MKKAGIIACSDGLSTEKRETIEKLKQYLLTQGYDAVTTGKYLFEEERSYPGNGKLRAKELMKLYEDSDITDIFDVSGGNQGNEVLDFLDYEMIKNSPARFWGYSDLSTVVNAIYRKTGKQSMLYQARFLVGDQAELQQRRFADWCESDASKVSQNDKEKNYKVKNKKEAFLTDLKLECVQGGPCEGILVGGNIRCFLKLAGTEYFPDLTDKILLLEAWSGGLPQVLTYLNQYKQLGAFRKAKGILLGTFTEMEKMQVTPEITELVKDIAGPAIPIWQTREVGHGHDAKAAVIGGFIKMTYGDGGM